MFYGKIKWMFKFSSRCSLSKEVVNSAVSNLDRFINTDRGCYVLNDDRLFQLATLSSLSISTKMIEGMNLNLNYLVDLSNNLYSIQDIIRMENMILISLKWKVNPPTSIIFIEYFMELLYLQYCTNNDINVSTIKEEKENNLKLSIIQAEAAVHNLNFCKIQPSLIAIACILNSIQSYHCNNYDNCSIVIANKDVAKQMYLEILVNNFDATTSHYKDLSFVRNNLVQEFRNYQLKATLETKLCPKKKSCHRRCQDDNNRNHSDKKMRIQR